MSLHIIIGCMFAGKTSKLISGIRKCQLLNQEYYVITHKSDNRYGINIISSHDNSKVYSNTCDKLMDLIENDNFKRSKFIFIEEGQFFEDLKIFALYCVEKLEKIVTICGLDGDFNRNRFGQILDLIPYSDTLEKLSAYCVECGDGTLANFSKRIVKKKGQKLVGSSESYKAVCRKHFLEE